MRGRFGAALLILGGIAAFATPVAAQTTVNSTSPTLAELLKDIYGPRGLIVDSQALLPDGSTHSAHFNGAFQSEFGAFNIALVRQLAALPVPSPASGFTYRFDSSTGTFERSTQSFGPILTDRAETIGRGRFAFGYALQQFAFQDFDGLPLSHIPAVFTHDDAQLGGGRADIITTQNSISTSVSQSTIFLTYGLTDRLDVSVAVPLVRTTLDVTSDATIQRIGTASNPAIHFFSDPAAPGTYGDERRFIASGSAQGLGDVILRAKTSAWRGRGAGVALGLEARLPTGQEQNLLGSGSFGLKLFEATSFSVGRLTPHFGAGYQWNAATVLAGDIATNQKGDLPNEFSYNVGGDAALNRRLTVVFDVLGRVSKNSPRMTRTAFIAQDPAATVYPNIAFNLETLSVVNGAAGMKLNVASTLLITFNLQFNLNNAGLRTRVTPLIGMEYGF
jgi:hypothetical protein